MPAAPDSIDYTHYLLGRTKAERMATLSVMANTQKVLPISLAEDLLCLDIGGDEKLLILACTGSKDALALEHFLTLQANSESQELATLALRLWDQKTQHLLWFRIANQLQSPLISQRVFYTIIDLAFHTGGSKVLQQSVHVDGLADMSEAMHGLLLHRACEWSVQHSQIDRIAESCLTGLGTHLHPSNKAMPSALAYIARYHPEEIASLTLRANVSEPWRDILRAISAATAHHAVQSTQLAKRLKSPEKTTLGAVSLLWPALWSRHTLSAETVAGALHVAAAAALKAANYGGTHGEASSPWEFFAGIPAATLEQSTLSLSDDRLFAASLTLLGGLLAVPASPSLLLSLKARLAATQDPGVLLAALPLRIRIELTEGAPSSGKKSILPYALVKKEEAMVLRGDKTATPYPFADSNPAVAEDADSLASRKRFFGIAYRSERQSAGQGTSFFDLLAKAWQAPNQDQLAQLADQSRRVDGIFRLCYINALGQFKGSDNAVLKLMDFIRSKEIDDLHAVLAALGKIATARSTFELVACLTRPNITPALQLETCLLLKKQNLSNLQNELHSAINDLGIEAVTAGVKWEVRELVSSMLDSTPAKSLHKSSEVSSGLEISDQRLDQELAGKIPHYRELSSEVKRALRTAQFFHMQVKTDGAPASIDLSPVIDMQYKSLELLFREVFEEPCSRLIHRGVLQRRLDIIGYARPIPSAMDEFEHFVSGLPTVREIPFFSAFKLRKMLRAICQYRPGRRFTLDGLKAFALFFLCFSRNECRYGLANLFPLGLRSDGELMQFAKMLHTMQDFRNRAAHEGFHPDAASDIDGIWRSTAEIVQTVFVIQTALQSLSGQGGHGDAREKKVS